MFFEFWDKLEIFPGKLVEVCQAADIPCPSDRIEAMKGVSKKRESDEYETFSTELKDLDTGERREMLMLVPAMRI